MGENKKENEQERVKIYDKDMYISQEKLRIIVVIIVIFVIGFIAGYFSNDLVKTNMGHENTQNYSNNINQDTE